MVWMENLKLVLVEAFIVVDSFIEVAFDYWTMATSSLEAHLRKDHSKHHHLAEELRLMVQDQIDRVGFVKEHLLLPLVAQILQIIEALGSFALLHQPSDLVAFFPPLSAHWRLWFRRTSFSWSLSLSRTSLPFLCVLSTLFLLLLPLRHEASWAAQLFFSLLPQLVVGGLSTTILFSSSCAYYLRQHQTLSRYHCFKFAVDHLVAFRFSSITND